MWSSTTKANLEPPTCDIREMLVATTTEIWGLFLTAAELTNTPHYHLQNHFIGSNVEDSKKELCPVYG